MESKSVIHAIEPVGDGNKQVISGEVDIDDISVSITQPFGDSNSQRNRPERTVWLSNEVLRNHVAVHNPGPEMPYDAVISIAGAPLPDAVDSSEDLSVNISVEQVRQAKAAKCPQCGGDLRETFEDGGCTVCGFYFDGTHLSDERQSELDHIYEEYDAEN
ncbi:hypothetical protein [Salinibaculum rarum]|uniref:hypothetical protein n=1 Tax=Salinibaculum rarum TaxID=3058903 RepID=UPI002660361E|nr:hypothetical protein [Salinibaculum sp. KK48]